MIDGYKQLAASVILQALEDMERYSLKDIAHAPKLVDGVVKMRTMPSEHAIEDIEWFLNTPTPFHMILDVPMDKVKDVYNRYYRTKTLLGG